MKPYFFAVAIIVIGCAIGLIVRALDKRGGVCRGKKTPPHPFSGFRWPDPPEDDDYPPTTAKEGRQYDD